MYKRFAVLFIFMGVSFSILYMRVFVITNSDEYSRVAVAQGRYTLTAGKNYGDIYDCNMLPFTNTSTENVAAVNPTAEGIAAVLSHARNKSDVRTEMTSELPFLCRVTADYIDCRDVKVFEVTRRFSTDQLAPHIIGYTRDGEGVSGLEYAYGYILHSDETSTKAVFEIDASGGVLEGFGIKVEKPDTPDAGVITTLDRDIQKICEDAATMEKGAVVVMTLDGELRAVVSKPDFDPLNLAASLESENSPFVNRAFSAYNVGSAFKLVTAAAAIEQGITRETEYECTGDIDVSGQRFRCHKLSGHGEINMCDAMSESCNTYFIELAQELDGDGLVDTAKHLGFGEKCYLANGITSVSGNLQSYSDMEIPAEKANMSFGQGKLTATPLQITRMSATIAGGGEMPQVRLVTGTIQDDVMQQFIKEPPVKAIEPLTAYELRKFMENSVDEESNAKPENTTAAGKTSTAQTGRYDDDGNEIVQAWFTGYFPADTPKYAVTVFVEDGITGNASAAPIFKEIAEQITWHEKGRIAEPVL